MLFLLDEFDLFARPLKQTLLYELLDVLQTTGVQVRIITVAELILAAATGPGITHVIGSSWQ